MRAAATMQASDGKRKLDISTYKSDTARSSAGACCLTLQLLSAAQHTDDTMTPGTPDQSVLPAKLPLSWLEVSEKSSASSSAAAACCLNIWLLEMPTIC